MIMAFYGLILFSGEIYEFIYDSIPRAGSVFFIAFFFFLTSKSQFNFPLLIYAPYIYVCIYSAKFDCIETFRG